METSIYLARLIGPTLMAMALVLLVNRDGFRTVVEEFLASRALIFLSGVLILLAGLAMVNAHNIWVADWPVIITIFGWLAIAGGVMRMAMPELAQELGGKVFETSAPTVGSGLLVLLGGFLTYVGYLA